LNVLSANPTDRLLRKSLQGCETALCFYPNARPLLGFTNLTKWYKPLRDRSMAKILLIEDDQALSTFLRDALRSRFHEVDHVSNGSDGLHWLKLGRYGLAIIDWKLPGLSGIEVCKAYRDVGGAASILMLTGNRAVQDRVQGLDSGADDYLAKPFEIDELLARVRALLRRKEKDRMTNSRLAIGDIELDKKSATVFCQGKQLQITRREFNILTLLMESPNQVLDNEAIIARVWPSDTGATPDVVRFHITRLRSKLRKASESAGDSIKSVYGMGYRFEAT